MLKSSDHVGLNPLSRVTPVLSVLAVGDPFQAIDTRSTQFAKGQHPPPSNLTLMQEAIADSLKNNVTTANFSPAAHLIDDLLKQAQLTGVATRFEAKTVITHSPKMPAMLAQDLKTAISNSGLFYESHLADYVDGRRTLVEIKQEPQNQTNLAANNLLPQQLAILENQRLSWHGDVWPNQKMDWDIYIQDDHESTSANKRETLDEEKPIASDLTLHLPKLGKVTAKISLKDGRMRIAMLAEESPTLAALKAQSNNLANAIEKNGQILEGLTVAAHE